MSELHEFEQQLCEAWPPAGWCDVCVVVAVSGGADSVGLLCALAAVNQQRPRRLTVAHFNHRLRGEESEADERFVRQLCEQRGLPLEVGHAPAVHGAAHDGKESESRRRRYQFLREVAHRLGARYVATAHTADDQAETVLHRVVRGTGLAGLAGIPTTRQLSQLTTIIRPLLSFPRSQVRDYLADLHQPFREDSSNRSLAFTRNRIRHGLLPQLACDYNPQVSQALIRLSQLAHEAQEVISTLVSSLVDRCMVHCSPELVRLDRLVLCDCRPFLVRELMKEIWKIQCWPRQDMGEVKWRQLCRMVQGHAALPPSVTLPGSIQVTVGEAVVELRRPAGPADDRHSDPNSVE